MSNKFPIQFESDIELAKQILIREGVKEMYLFGSLINGNAHDDSDIDIATVGLDEYKFFSIYGELLQKLDHEIDLVGLDYQNEFSKMLKDSGKIERIF